MLIFSAWICAITAVPPFVLVLWNLYLVRRRHSAEAHDGMVSVLIPARNEAKNIGPAIESVLKSSDTRFEVVVLDDDSVDSTASVVTEISKRDNRVRLIRGTPLPAGVCGKPFACQRLAESASGDIFVFVDADVRLRPQALAVLASELKSSGAAMISGIPMQVTNSTLEKLVIPLMHFIMYAYLPIFGMRHSYRPAFGAACGQLIAVQRDAYERLGGHASIQHMTHDGIALARQFRMAGQRTDIIDATDLAECRMYADNKSLLLGLAKNAHEGLGSPRGIVPWTLLLLVPHVAPFVLFPMSLGSSRYAMLLAIAIVFAWLGRFILAARFRQSILGAIAHPIGVATLVGIQWYALYLRKSNKPVKWKGRRLPSH